MDYELTNPVNDGVGAVEKGVGIFRDCAIGKICKFGLIHRVTEPATFKRRDCPFQSRRKTGNLGCSGHAIVKRLKNLLSRLLILGSTGCRGHLGCRLLS